MPTLIRLVVALLFIGALAYGAMFALTIFVTPNQKQVTVRIPQRELALTPVVPAPQAPVAAAAVLPPSDDTGSKVVNTPDE